ncbi:phage tail tube protein [Desulfosarcina ovata]|uniref:Tail protein n=1 Tax=Desulfosarcina ovata subsp. ovata TaxID=2752305 RepID=A0A5K8AH90_9BACT|nr:phage tail tube protein [Desulfosarcina ovata]BBO92052.1 hypothetical protein DSCOOX_52320 [Desulfosarcina ovata subsp. ovata]
MGQALGSKSRLVMDFEDSFKTEPGTPAGMVMPINTFSLKSSRTKNTAQTITGSRNPVKPFDGNLSDSGEGVVPVDSQAFGWWLRAMFGAPTTTGTSPYTHVFKVGDSMPSMVMEVRFQDKTASVLTYAKHNGCKISSFNMSVGGDDELTAKVGIEAATETIGSTAYDSDPTVLSLNRFNNYQATIEEGGASIADVTAMDFTIDFGLDTDVYTIGDGGTRGQIPEGILSVTGSITALFNSDTLLNKAINSTESSLKLTFTSGADSLEFAFNELEFERQTPSIDGPKGVLITLPFVAFYDDDAAASVVTATLINTVETYA